MLDELIRKAREYLYDFGYVTQAQQLAIDEKTVITDVNDVFAGGWRAFIKPHDSMMIWGFMAARYGLPFANAIL